MPRRSDNRTRAGTGRRAPAAGGARDAPRPDAPPPAPQERGDGTAAPLVPAGASLSALRDAARGCRACPLWERGTQTVFGQGPRLAEVMLVGEQVTEHRGELLSTPLAPIALATAHPSAILRAPDDEARRAAMLRFVEDLERLAEALRSTVSPPSPPA